MYTLDPLAGLSDSHNLCMVPWVNGNYDVAAPLKQFQNNVAQRTTDQVMHINASAYITSRPMTIYIQQ